MILRRCQLINIACSLDAQSYTNDMNNEQRQKLFFFITSILGGRTFILTRWMAPFFLLSSALHADPVVEVRAGVVFTLSAQALYGGWNTVVPAQMPGTGWNRILHLGYAPFLTLTNNANQAIAITGNPIISFHQPNLGLKISRIGASPTGVITTVFVPLDQMYSQTSAKGNKSYQFTLYNTVASNVGSGEIRLAAGESIVLSPVNPNSWSFDWQNNLTNNILAAPGWHGYENTFWTNFLAGTSANLTAGLNANLGVIASRDTDLWDVQTTFTGALNGWKVYDLRDDRTPIHFAESTREIAAPSFKISDYRGVIATSDMKLPIQPPQVKPSVQSLFSAISSPLPVTLTTRVVDSDNNSLDDDWEIQYFQGIGVDPQADPDGDGYNNFFEYRSKLSPISVAERFTQILSRQNDGNMLLTWSSSPGVVYAIEQSNDMINWMHVTNEVGSGPGSLTTSCMLGQPQGPAKYFRIRLSGAM